MSAYQNHINKLYVAIAALREVQESVPMMQKSLDDVVEAKLDLIQEHARYLAIAGAEHQQNAYDEMDGSAAANVPVEELY